MRKIFRHPISDIYMVIAFMLAMLAAFSVMTFQSVVNDLKSDATFFSYENYTYIQIQKNDVEVDPEKLFQDVEGVIILEDQVVTDDRIEAMRLCQVLVSATENMKLTYSNGEWVKESDFDVDLDDNIILVGKGQKDSLFFENDKQYASINGCLYRVLGIVESRKSDYLDDTMLLSYKNMDIMSLDRIRSQSSWTVFLGSDKHSCGQMIDKIKENAAKYYSKIVISESDVLYSEDYGEYESNKVLYLLLMTFCLVLIVISSDFFIWERKKEITIRRICGQTDGQIFVDIYVQLWILSAGTALLCFAGQWILNYLGISIMGISLSIRPEHIILCILAISFFALCALILPMNRIKKVTVNASLCMIEGER